MNLHEHQAKALLAAHGVAVPAGGVAASAEEAARVARELGGQRWVVKAQIHAGGRGKAGGVKIGNSPAKIAEIADQMLGSTLVTEQTGPAGQTVSRVLVRSEEHTSELQSQSNLVCRLLL